MRTERVMEASEHERTAYWRNLANGQRVITLRQRRNLATFEWLAPTVDVQYAADLSPTDALNLGMRLQEAAGLAELWKCFPPEEKEAA